jgi:hypothetical protein
VAERLLDHHPAPEAAAVGVDVLTHQAGLAQTVDDRREEAGGNREIEDHVAFGTVMRLGPLKLLADALVEFRVLEVAAHIAHA